MLPTFDSKSLSTSSGVVFGRIYEYFLAEFSKQRAHDNGEFFTPPVDFQDVLGPTFGRASSDSRHGSPCSLS
jgi:type I restriction enzyme M protein